MKYRVLQNKKELKQGDVVELKEDFWTKYMQIKGIIQPYSELEIQTPPEKKTLRRKKK